MDKSNIAILTTVVNFELYAITSNLFPMGIRKYAIDGRNGMHGIHSIIFAFNKLLNKNIEWSILADEDVIFKNANVVYSIINKMEEENISVCGIRDGGVIKHRQFNPHLVNTFFTILNFKEISSEWNKSEIKKHQYILPNEFKFNENIFKEPFDVKSLYEPYYCFFLWLKRKDKKFLYLEAQMLNDNISNTILYNGEPFAYHTWYARSYNVNEKQTNRINSILDNMNIDINSTKIDSNILIIKDLLFYYKMELSKLYKRFINRMNGKYRNI